MRRKRPSRAASGARQRRRQRRRLARQPSALLRALTAGALALPGLAGPAAADSPPTETRSDYRYSRYAEDSLPSDKVAAGGERSRYEIDIHQFRFESGISDGVGIGIDLTHEAMSGATPWYITPGHERRAGAGDDRGHDRRGAHRRAGLGRATTSTAARRRSAAASRPRTTTSPSTASLGGERNFNEKNTTLSGGIGASFDRITPTDTSEFPTRPRPRRTSRATTATSRSRRCSARHDRADVGQVPARARLPLRPVQARVRRRHPGDRRAARRAPPVLVAHALPPPLPVGSRARCTSTTCSTPTTGSIDSHTFELAWYQTLFDRFRLVPSARYYSQSQADFYAPFYTAPRSDGLRSSDYRLSPFGAYSYRIQAEFPFEIWELQLGRQRGVRALRERRRPRARVGRRREPGPRLVQPVHGRPDRRASSPGWRSHRFRFKAMGCPCALQIHAESAREARAWAASARGEIARLEQKYSRYRADSLLSRINASAGDPSGVEVDAETASLLDYAATCHAQSGGLFDITSGILRRAWDFRSGRLPEPARIAELLPLRRLGEGALVGPAHRAAARGHGARPGRLREGVRRRPRRRAAARGGLHARASSTSAAISRSSARTRTDSPGSSGSATRRTRSGPRCRCRCTRAASRRAATTSAAWWSTACATGTSSIRARAGRSRASRASPCSRRAASSRAAPRRSRCSRASARARGSTRSGSRTRARRTAARSSAASLRLRARRGRGRAQLAREPVGEIAGSGRRISARAAISRWRLNVCSVVARNAQPSTGMSFSHGIPVLAVGQRSGAPRSRSPRSRRRGAGSSIRR